MCKPSQHSRAETETLNTREFAPPPPPALRLRACFPRRPHKQLPLPPPGFGSGFRASVPEGGVRKCPTSPRLLPARLSRALSASLSSELAGTLSLSLALSLSFSLSASIVCPYPDYCLGGSFDQKHTLAAAALHCQCFEMLETCRESHVSYPGNFDSLSVEYYIKETHTHTGTHTHTVRLTQLHTQNY